MCLTLGIDTSNYTTSVAVYDSESCKIQQKKKMLFVEDGQIGLRQSDAVFLHVQQLGEVLSSLLHDVQQSISAVGVSLKPQDTAGSYMPCFLAGKMAAQSVSAALKVPIYGFSHQAGHIASALFGADKMQLVDRQFLAFHVSGGTTQCLHVSPCADKVFSITEISRSLDLNAGQLVDRVGALLGLPFPAGPQLEQLAGDCETLPTPKIKLKGLDCCLSGVENQCSLMHKNGVSGQEIVAHCITYIRETVHAMTKKAVELHPNLPIIYAGGVMSNQSIQKSLAKAFEGYFAPPAFSADNAAGTAILCRLSHKRGLCR